jgi:glutaredoxin
MAVEHVDGKPAGKIILYALSTCVWCSKIKELLRELGISFDYVYVDLLESQKQQDAMSEIERWNPRGSFPTLIIGENKSIIGYQEKEIREAFGA